MSEDNNDTENPNPDAGENPEEATSSAVSDDRSFSFEKTMESVVRITSAGFGGSLVGLALDRQQQAAKITSPNVRPAIAMNKASASIPTTWAISCMVFAFLLETSRRASPTTVVWNAIQPEHEKKDIVIYEKTAITAIGDMTIGGSFAGLAGALATRKRPLVTGAPPPRALWGLGVGLGLGLVAGIFQAGIDVGNMYLVEQRDKDDD